MTWPLRKKYLVVSQKLKIPLPCLLSIVLTGIYPREIQIRFVQKYVHKCLLQLFFFFLVMAKTRKNLELFPTFICNCTVFGGWLSVLGAGSLTLNPRTAMYLPRGFGKEEHLTQVGVGMGVIKGGCSEEVASKLSPEG